MSPRKQLKKGASKNKQGSRKRRKLDSAWKDVIERIRKTVKGRNQKDRGGT